MAKAKLDLSEARADYARGKHERAAAVLRHLEDDLDEVDAKSRAEYWELMLRSTEVWSAKKALEAARALLASEPRASRATRALRTAELAVAECCVDKKRGYNTLQQALELAPNDETRAKVLVMWGNGRVEHDRVTPAAALLDAYDLVKRGKLTKGTAMLVLEHCAFNWPNASTKRAQKGQDALCEARKIDPWMLAEDCYRRFVALDPEPSDLLVRVVMSIGLGLIYEGRDIPQAIAIYDRWSPMFEAACLEGHIHRGSLIHVWHNPFAEAFGSANAGPEAERARRAAEAFQDP